MAKSFAYEEKYYELVRENTSLQKLIQDQNLRIYDLEMQARIHTAEIADLHKIIKQVQDGVAEMRVEMETLKEENRELKRKLEVN